MAQSRLLPIHGRLRDGELLTDCGDCSLVLRNILKLTRFSFRVILAHLPLGIMKSAVNEWINCCSDHVRDISTCISA